MIAGVSRRSVEVKHLSLLLGLIHSQEQEIEVQLEVEYEKKLAQLAPASGCK